MTRDKTSTTRLRVFAAASVFFILAMALFTFARLALITTYAGNAFELVPLLKALWMGARFDAKAAALLALLPTVPLALVSIIPRCTHTTTRLALIALIAIWIGLVFLVIINHYYFCNFQNHFDIFVFGLVEDDTQAVMATVFEDYPVTRNVALWLAASTLGGWIIVRASALWDDWPKKHLNRAVLVAGWLVIAVILGRGSLGLFPLSPNIHLGFTENTFLNRSALNAVIALNEAFETRAVRSKPTPVNENQARQALEIWRALDPDHAPNTLDPQDPFGFQPLQRATPSPAPHIVLAIRESFGTALLAHQQDSGDLLGALAPHWRDDFVFTHFVSASLGTHASLEKTLLGLPIGDFTLSAERKKTQATSLAAFYKRMGYATAFVIGGSKSWHDLDLMLPHQGFETLYDQSDITASVPGVQSDGNWGVFDEYTYAFVQQLLEKSTKSLFVAILNT